MDSVEVVNRRSENRLRTFLVVKFPKRSNASAKAKAASKVDATLPTAQNSNLKKSPVSSSSTSSPTTSPPDDSAPDDMPNRASVASPAVTATVFVAPSEPPKPVPVLRASKELGDAVPEDTTDDQSQRSAASEKSKSPESRRIQTLVIKKKRSSECFADAQLDAAASSSFDRSVEESKTFVLSDPQKAAVSATVSLGRPKKLSLQKASKCSNPPSSSVSSFATPTSAGFLLQLSKQQQLTLQPSNNARSSSDESSRRPSSQQAVVTSSVATPQTPIVPVVSSQTPSSSFRPVLIVHPAQKSLSNNALHAFSTLPSGLGSTSTVPGSGSACCKTTATAASSLGLTSTGQFATAAASASADSPSSNTSTLNSTASGTSRSGAEGRESSFTNRLTRGLLDLTQGSSDRLQRWKSKLQNGRRQKDTSEPPPETRKMPAIEEPSGHSSDVEMLVDWAPAKLSSQPKARPLQFSCANSAFTAKIAKPRVLQPTRSTSDLAKPDGAEKGISLTDSEMEHRTLKQRDDNSSKSTKNLSMHYQNMKNLQHLVQTIEGYDNVNNNLPPPARIMPVSGIKPQDSDIIRPVPFRPLAAGKRLDTRQSITSASSSIYAKSDSEPPCKPLLSNGEQCKRSSRDWDVTAGMPSSASVGPPRPRAIYQPSTSSEASSSSVPQFHVAKLPKTENEENDYDVVPEYIDRDKLMADDSGSSDNYSVVYHSPLHPSMAPQSHQRSASQTNGHGFTTFSVNSPSMMTKKSPPSHHQPHGSTASNGSRHSSGIHVTPSPSDSGIVDYESIIRDKENELSNVRSTMEQNEEVMVRVYQEKERIWKEQLAEVKQKLSASQQGENALRQQIQRCTEQRDQYQATIQSLTNDKQGLQRKCLQIERELFQIREKFDELLRCRESKCEACRRLSSAVDGERRGKQPIPAPRQNKDSGSTDRELRTEVDQLRGEVSTLREALTEQIGFFADERKRWEREISKMGSPKGVRGKSSEVLLPPERIPPSNGASKQCVVSRDRLI